MQGDVVEADLIATPEAAELLGVDRTMVGRFVAAGRLSVALGGGDKRAKWYRRADVVALKAERDKT